MSRLLKQQPSYSHFETIKAGKSISKYDKAPINLQYPLISENVREQAGKMGKENWINKGLNLRTDNVVFLPTHGSTQGDFFIFFSARLLTQWWFLDPRFYALPFGDSFLLVSCFSVLLLLRRTIPSRVLLFSVSEEKLQNKRCNNKTNLSSRVKGGERYLSNAVEANKFYMKIFEECKRILQRGKKRAARLNDFFFLTHDEKLQFENFKWKSMELCTVSVQTWRISLSIYPLSQTITTLDLIPSIRLSCISFTSSLDTIMVSMNFLSTVRACCSVQSLIQVILSAVFHYTKIFFQTSSPTRNDRNWNNNHDVSSSICVGADRQWNSMDLNVDFVFSNGFACLIIQARLPSPNRNLSRHFGSLKRQKTDFVFKTKLNF